jgi:hypothetical protein
VSGVLIARGSVWKFYDGGANLGISWSSPLLNDATWQSGPAELGYGDGDEATVVSFGSNANAKNITTYFRRSFVVEDAAAITNLTWRLVRDDGAVVFLNGVQQYRSNLPATGSIGYTTLASGTVNNAEESVFFETMMPATAWVSGTNVVGVEVHQASANSSDISFNLELRGTGPGSPPVPVLDYVWDGAVLALSWSGAAWTAGWRLYGINTLDGDAIWAPVPGGSPAGGRWVVLVVPEVAGGAVRFFRLQKP